MQQSTTTADKSQEEPEIPLESESLKGIAMFTYIAMIYLLGILHAGYSESCTITDPPLGQLFSVLPRVTISEPIETCIVELRQLM